MGLKRKIERYGVHALEYGEWVHMVKNRATKTNSQFLKNLKSNLKTNEVEKEVHFKI